jgi:HAD superfamily hydrolase (TIGR01509 family)
VIRAVIFDVDGTLVDTNDLHTASWVEAFRRFGHEIPPETVRRQMGKGGDQLMPAVLPRDAFERQGKEIAEYRGVLFMREYLPRAKAFPEVPALLRRVRAAGQRVVLASSSSAAEVERYKEIAGIADLIDDATTKDDAEHSKPSPDIFRAALDRIAPIPPGEAVAVGDSPFDAEAAAKLGLRTVGLLCGGFPEDELWAAGFVALYRDPVDLLARYDVSPLAPGGGGA